MYYICDIVVTDMLEYLFGEDWFWSQDTILSKGNVYKKDYVHMDDVRKHYSSLVPFFYRLYRTKLSAAKQAVEVFLMLESDKLSNLRSVT